RYTRGAPADFATPRSGNSASHDRSTYGCTFRRSQTSAALKSARFGISTGAATSGIRGKIIAEGAWLTPTRSDAVLDAGMAEAPAAARCGGQLHDLVPRHAHDRRDDELRDPHTARHVKRRVTEIDDRHANLAAVIRIDRRRRVRHADAVLHGKPRS